MRLPLKLRCSRRDITGCGRGIAAMCRTGRCFRRRWNWTTIRRTARGCRYSRTCGRRGTSTGSAGTWAWSSAALPPVGLFQTGHAVLGVRISQQQGGGGERPDGAADLREGGAGARTESGVAGEFAASRCDGRSPVLPRRTAVLDEQVQQGSAASGTRRTGRSRCRATLSGRCSGDLNLSLFPTKKLTIVNNTSVDNLRISGNSAYTDVSNGINPGETINFRHLGIRMVTNMTDVNYQVKNWIAVYGGYGYTDRLVTTIEGFQLAAFPDNSPAAEYENSNHLNTGTIGIRARLWKRLTASIEGSIGRANNPLTPVSDRNYDTINGRIDYRTRKVQLSTSYKQYYNVNAPVALSAEVRTRGTTRQSRLSRIGSRWMRAM